MARGEAFFLFYNLHHKTQPHSSFIHIFAVSRLTSLRRYHYRYEDG
ncbi:hypothetical protein [Cronobacter dublinensis]|nr:hypothetical protein [Cronobacter dublinensis]